MEQNEKKMLTFYTRDILTRLNIHLEKLRSELFSAGV